MLKPSSSLWRSRKTSWQPRHRACFALSNFDSPSVSSFVPIGFINFLLSSFLCLCLCLRLCLCLSLCLCFTRLSLGSLWGLLRDLWFCSFGGSCLIHLVRDFWRRSLQNSSRCRATSWPSFWVETFDTINCHNLWLNKKSPNHAKHQTWSLFRGLRRCLVRWLSQGRLSLRLRILPL